MADKTRYERMREAADILDEASVEAEGRGVLGTCDIWNAAGLRERADQWEREDTEKAAAAAAYDKQVEELAKAICAHDPDVIWTWHGASEGYKQSMLGIARDLIDAGWTKTEPS